ncbi:hypothetical protein [Streptomyces sp. NPDC008121]|uniref:hypothetical protein n=1 Tax=Streptomyces sp. NPDC008121 TaxID=3364809 RepID=UPI0036E9286E
MDIFAIRQALADAARAVVLPAGVAKLTSTAHVPDAVSAPHFFVAEYEIEFDKAMRRALDQIQFTARILVGRADELSAQRLLDSMLSGSGPTSLKTAIEVARGAPGEYALGGLAHDLHVLRVQGNRLYEHAGTQYIGAEIVIKVIGEGSP